MHSIKEIFTVGYGPSSSHTMGPRKAAEIFLKKMPDAAYYSVTLYGSLAATGKGHLTDMVIKDVFKDKKFEIRWEPKTFLHRHPNAIKFEASGPDGQILKERTAYSVSGGTVIDDNYSPNSGVIYSFTTMDDILSWCSKNGKQLWEYVEEYEGSEIWDFLDEIWQVMVRSVENGLIKEGTLPGILKLPRKASSYQAKARNLSDDLRDRVYALLSDGRHYVSFDRVIQVMKQSGSDLSNFYKETSEGGLAFLHEMNLMNICLTRNKNAANDLRNRSKHEDYLIQYQR